MRIRGQHARKCYWFLISRNRLRVSIPHRCAQIEFWKCKLERAYKHSTWPPNLVRRHPSGAAEPSLALTITPRFTLDLANNRRSLEESFLFRALDELLPEESFFPPRPSRISSVSIFHSPSTNDSANFSTELERAERCVARQVFSFGLKPIPSSILEGNLLSRTLDRGGCRFFESLLEIGEKLCLFFNGKKTSFDIVEKRTEGY